MPSSPRLGSSLASQPNYQPIVSTCARGEEESSPLSHVALTTKSDDLSERPGSLQAILLSSSHLYGDRMETEEGRGEVRTLGRPAVTGTLRNEVAKGGMRHR